MNPVNDFPTTPERQRERDWQAATVAFCAGALFCAVIWGAVILAYVSVQVTNTKGQAPHASPLNP